MRMGRKNLYIPDEDESLVARLEKRLEQQDQSLSDFFVQSVRSAVAAPLRGRATSKPKVYVPIGLTCAIVVDANWRHSHGVTALVGAPDNPIARAPDSSLLIAKVLGVDDPVGLWIELSSEEKRRSGFPVLRFAIPWRFVLGVCVNPEDPLSDVIQSEKQFGFSPGIDLTSSTGARAIDCSNDPRSGD
jgi:hypothetical protein